MGERQPGQITIPNTFTIPEEFAIAIRDRLLTIPGVREVAEELRLLPGSDLHSACIESDFVALSQNRNNPSI